MELAKPVRQALVDSTFRSSFKRRSLRSSKAGGRSGFLLRFVTVACVLLCGSRLVLNSMNSHSNRTRHSQVETHFTAAAQFDEAEGRLRDHGTVEASGMVIAMWPHEKSDREMHLASEKEESLMLNDVAGARADLEERLGDEEKAERKWYTSILARANLKRGEETRASEEIEASAEPDSVHSAYSERNEVPDAISFLERLTASLTKTGQLHHRILLRRFESFSVV